MKQLIYLSILLIVVVTCLSTSCTTAPAITPLPSNTDSSHKGSNFSISYTDSNGIYWTYASKDVSHGSEPVVQITTSVLKPDSVNYMLAINLVSPYSVYGISVVNFYLRDNGTRGTGIGTYSFASPSMYDNILSEFGQVYPPIVFSDSVGTATITHNGADYIEGTFATTIYFRNSPGSYAATGSFTIYH